MGLVRVVWEFELGKMGAEHVDEFFWFDWEAWGCPVMVWTIL